MSREPFHPRSRYRYWTQISTRWHDNDVYGHVNNTIYYGWIDTAVNLWLVETGLLDIEHGDPIGLIVESGCVYASSISFPQAVEVGIIVSRLGNSSVTYHAGVFAKDAPEAAVQGHMTHVYVDRATRRPAPLPEVWRSKLRTLE